MTCLFVDRKTHKIAYIHEKGDILNPVVVFLPGYRSDMGGTKSVYLKQKAKDKGWGYISLDYYGHGQSDGQVENGMLSMWVADVLAVLDQCGYKKHILVGSSMGGWVMLHVALKRPDLIDRLVGIAAAPDFITPLMANLPTSLKHDYETVGCFVYPTPLNSQGWIIKKHFIEDGLKHCLLTSPISLNMPVYLLHGYGDIVVPWTVSATLMGCLTSESVQLHIIKDGEHHLSRDQDLELIHHAVFRQRCLNLESF